jgi:hypothetical protein
LRRPISAVILALFAVGLLGCADSKKKTAGATSAFLEWNALVIAGDPAASQGICSKPVDDFSLDPNRDRGFQVSGEISSSVTGQSATVAFESKDTDGNGPLRTQDIYVDMVKESGTWKVCRIQRTAAGGFG